jgi:UDP-N-acetylglucosamine transferase subunit ALG13
VIFVTVGTTDFDELIQRMDELAPELGEEVVSQIARGSYRPRNGRYFRFAPSLDSYLADARLVVSHGGLGSIMETIRLGKPLVGVSNPDRRDLHQDDLLGTLESGNHILWCRSLDDLKASIASAATMQFARYDEPPCTIHTAIQDFLERQVVGRRTDMLRGVLRRVRL